MRKKKSAKQTKPTEIELLGNGLLNLDTALMYFMETESMPGRILTILVKLVLDIGRELERKDNLIKPKRKYKRKGKKS